MHRAYFQFFYLSEYHQSLFSPEEIYSLRLKYIFQHVETSIIN